MKKMKYFITIILLFTGLASCEYEDYQTICDQQVIISKVMYYTAPSEHLAIMNAEITGDCLTIRFASSGCDGTRWVLKLIDSGDLLYSDLPQRNLRLSLYNPEFCDAYIMKEISFDVKKLRAGGNEVLLNLTNSNTQISYKY